MNLSFLKGIPIPDKSTHDLKSIHLRQYMSHPGYHLSLRDMVQYDYELALFLIKGFFNPRLHHLLISILFYLHVPDKSLVLRMVTKCITSKAKDTIIIVFFIPIDKSLTNIKWMWTLLDGTPYWSIFWNSFLMYNSDILIDKDRLRIRWHFSSWKI